MTCDGILIEVDQARLARVGDSFLLSASYFFSLASFCSNCSSDRRRENSRGVQQSPEMLNVLPDDKTLHDLLQGRDCLHGSLS